MEIWDPEPLLFTESSVVRLVPDAFLHGEVKWLSRIGLNGVRYVQHFDKASCDDICSSQSYEFRDVHTQVLGVLRNYVETEENAAHLYQSGCILRLLAYLEMALPAMKPHCLAVLTKMSFTSNGRDVSCSKDRYYLSHTTKFCVYRKMYNSGVLIDLFQTTFRCSTY